MVEAVLAAVAGGRCSGIDGGLRIRRARRRSAAGDPGSRRRCRPPGATAGRRRTSRPGPRADRRLRSSISRAGQRELEQGHVEPAEDEFNRAVDVLLESPVRRADRAAASASTSTGWSIASAPTKSRRSPTGDGFTEKKYEPASIDELLALSTTLRPRRRRRPS